jgi:hypothetical protein
LAEPGAGGEKDQDSIARNKKIAVIVENSPPHPMVAVTTPFVFSLYVLLSFC